MNLDLNIKFMDLAIDKAYDFIFLTYPNPAVGAVVVKDGAVLSIEAHRAAGESHAEVLALIGAYETLNSKKVDIDRYNAKDAHKFLLSLEKEYFRDCVIYVTLEPCSHSGKTPSCAKLLNELKLKQVIIGAKDPIISHSGGVEMLKSSGVDVIMLNHKRASELIEPFKIWQDRAFVLFKLAQGLNGVIGGGYISSSESLLSVHKIRDVATKLLIGGNTVRVDRPTLDCRLLNSNAPDTLIYSKDKIFDRDIPLFNVPNRDVEISDNLEFLKEKGLVLVEGGEGMLNALKDKIDWLLIYQAPKILPKSVGYYSNINLEYLHTSINNNDLTILSRVKKC